MAQYDSVFRSMYHICETIGSGSLLLSLSVYLLLLEQDHTIFRPDVVKGD